MIFQVVFFNLLKNVIKNIPTVKEMGELLDSVTPDTPIRKRID